MNSNIQSETKRLKELQAKYATANGAIVGAKDAIARCYQQISKARVNALLDPENNTPKATEALCKKLEGEKAAAEAELQKWTPEAAVLAGAIVQLESEIIPRRHSERLQMQTELRDEYTALAREILEVANTFAALNAKAKAKYDAALVEFPKDETCEGQDIVRKAGGTAPIWNSRWISWDWPERDVTVSAVYEFDPSLVDPLDPVADRKRHYEEHRQREAARHERERLQWQGVIPPDRPTNPQSGTFTMRFAKPNWKAPVTK